MHLSDKFYLLIYQISSEGLAFFLQNQEEGEWSIPKGSLSMSPGFEVYPMIELEPIVLETQSEKAIAIESSHPILSDCTEDNFPALIKMDFELTMGVFVSYERAYAIVSASYHPFLNELIVILLERNLTQSI